MIRLSGTPLARNAFLLGAAGLRRFPRARAALDVPGFMSLRELVALGRLAREVPARGTIVEIGSFLGQSALMMAAFSRPEVKIVCIDPFDASGDPFSVPFYESMIGDDDQLASFEENIESIADRVEYHVGVASSAKREPCDLLLLDGDHSRHGMRAAFDAWIPWVEIGGRVVVNNSGPGAKADDHDGGQCLVAEVFHAPRFEDVQRFRQLTWATLAVR